MKSEEKIWGSVRHIFVDEVVAVSHLLITAHRFCSLHRHVDRVNQFTVIAGHLDILHFANANHQGDPSLMPYMVKQLFKGDTYIVKNGLWHQFVSRTDCLVIETYWTENGAPVSIDDIDRRTEGGCLHG